MGFARISHYFLEHAPKRTIAVMECTEMSSSDQWHFDQVFGRSPYLSGVGRWKLILRQRLWWHAQEPYLPPGIVQREQAGTSVIALEVGVGRRAKCEDILEEGFSPCDIASGKVLEDNFHVASLCCHNPRTGPMQDLRVLASCEKDTLERWKIRFLGSSYIPLPNSQYGGAPTNQCHQAPHCSTGGRINGLSAQSHSSHLDAKHHASGR